LEKEKEKKKKKRIKKVLKEKSKNRAVHSVDKNNKVRKKGNFIWRGEEGKEQRCGIKKRRKGKEESI